MMEKPNAITSCDRYSGQSSSSPKNFPPGMSVRPDRDRGPDADQQREERRHERE